MTKRSRHYCTVCGSKQPFQVEKFGPFACLFVLPAIVNLTRAPHCETCGARYRGPLVAGLARLRHRRHEKPAVS